MKIILAALGLVGLYVLLGLWTSIHHYVAFRALGMDITWYAIFFTLGAVLILRATVLGKG